MDDEVFVAGRNPKSNVTVYNSHNLTALRVISITGMKSPVSLAICAYNKALYVSDRKLRCIHRADLTNNCVTRWKMRKKEKPADLSVTAELTLLVTVVFGDTEGCSSSSSSSSSGSGVVEYTSKGERLRVIPFDESIELAKLTLQLSSDQFIVCCNECSSSGIFIIGTEGQIIKSYGGESGGGEGQLDHPSSMAIDINSNHIFVGDLANNKVILFDYDLNYLGQVRTTYLLKYPYSMYFHSSTNRLFIVNEYLPLIVITHPCLRNQKNKSLGDKI